MLFGPPAVRSAPKTPWLIALIPVLCGPADAQAQTPPPPVAEDVAAPDVYLLPDATGKLRQVMGFRYEDFLRTWNQRGDAAGPPQYSIDEVSASGALIGARAELRVEINITSHTAGWVNVPLELPDFIVERVEISDQSDGECFIYDTNQRGHVAWLLGRPGQQRAVAVVGSAKISTGGEKSALELRLPRATIRQLTLKLPGTDLTIDSSAEVQSTTTPAGETEVVVRGNSTPLRVGWRPRRADATTEATTLQAQGDVAVRVGPHKAVYTAKLLLESFDEPLDRVRVRLPRGASLTEAGSQGHQATVDGVEDALGIVEIALSQPAGKTHTLELSAEQPIDEGIGAKVCQVRGFEVIGAVQQSGSLTLEVEEGLQAYFDLEGNVEQVALDAGDAGEALAAFEYSRFPWQLSVHTLPKLRRVNIEPRYRLSLGQGEARLETEFDYQFTGSKTFAVRIDLRGWQLGDQPLESGGAVEASRVVETEEGMLVLPLVNPDTQRVRIALTLRTPLEFGPQEFDLPEALGGFVLPGQLVVEADPSLQVTTNSTNLKGLGALVMEPGTPTVVGRQEFRTFLARASLGATVTRRPRESVVTSQTFVTVLESKLLVRQLFDCVVSNRPLRVIKLQATRKIPELGSCKLWIDGNESPLSLPIVEPGEDEAEIRHMAIALPRPLQGKFRIELEYEYPHVAAASSDISEVSLPLVLATGSTNQEVIVEASPAWRIALAQTDRSESWSLRPAEALEGSEKTIWRLNCTNPQATLPLLVHRVSLADLQNATLERAWLQTWIAGDVQQERAVFRFRTTHASVHAELPMDSVNRPIEVLLDGEPIEFERPAHGRLSVPLSHASPQIDHVLEVRYQNPVELRSGAVVRADFPKLVSRGLSAPVYWQVVLPRGWQVVQSPPGMTSESWLGWKQYRWGRQPTRSQSELEQWSGASSASPPPESTSQYVYSAFEIPETAAIIISHQVWLVSGATLVAFSVGLLCIYSQVARKFWFWLATALALGALVFMYPELTLLAGQAILWGGLMTLSVIVLRRAFERRTIGEIVAIQASALTGSTSATQSWIREQRLTADADNEPTVVTHMEEANP